MGGHGFYPTCLYVAPRNSWKIKVLPTNSTTCSFGALALFAHNYGADSGKLFVLFIFIFLAPYFLYQNRNVVVLVVVVFSLRVALSLFEWLWFSQLRSSSVKLPCLFYCPLKTMGLDLSGCSWGLGHRATATKSRKNGAAGSWAGNRKSAWKIVLQDFPNI